MSSQSVMALQGIPCSICAKDFAPGQLSKNFEIGKDAKDFAPGQLNNAIPVPCDGCNGASQFAPGQEQKDIGTIGQ